MSEQREHTRSVDAEGTLIASAAANVESLWLAALDLVFLPNTKIMSNDSGDQLVEIGRLGTRRPAERLFHGARQENCRDQTHQMQRVISTVKLRNSTASRSETLGGKIKNFRD